MQNVKYILRIFSAGMGVNWRQALLKVDTVAADAVRPVDV